MYPNWDYFGEHYVYITFMLCCFSSLPAMAKRKTTKVQSKKDPDHATIYKSKLKKRGRRWVNAATIG